MNDLISEDAQMAFVRSFRHLVRQLNKLNSFTDFTWEDLGLDKQTFEDFKSKYLDIYDHTRKEKEEGVSIINEVNFELELIHRDEVNMSYILKLLGDIQSKHQEHGPTEETRQQTQETMKMLGNEVQLRSKRELIEKFVNDYMPNLAPEQDLDETFGGFWQHQKRQAVHELCEQEQLDKTAFYGLLDEYTFTGKPPLREQVFTILAYKPKLLERKNIYERIMEKFNSIIETYEENTGLIQGVSEPEIEYDTSTQANLAHQLGDRSLYFTDQVVRSRAVHSIATFTLHLDTPYRNELASLNQYSLGSELLAHGVVNDDTLAQYLSLTSRLQFILSAYDIPFVAESNILSASSEQQGQSVLFWSLSEAREGSTVLEFVLQYWEVFTGVGAAGVYKFILDYPKLSDGLKHMKRDIKKLLPQKIKDQDTEPMIIVDDVALEFRELLGERD